MSIWITYRFYGYWYIPEKFQLDNMLPSNDNPKIHNFTLLKIKVQINRKSLFQIDFSTKYLFLISITINFAVVNKSFSVILYIHQRRIQKHFKKRREGGCCCFKCKSMSKWKKEGDRMGKQNTSQWRQCTYKVRWE